MRSRLHALAFLVPFVAMAEENAPLANRERGASVARHFIVTAEHTLRADETAQLAAAGIEVQQVLPDRRYIVRAAKIEDVAGDPRIASVVSIAAAHKIDRSAYREAALARPFARIRLVFHDDVSFADAQAAVTRVGGSVEQLLAADYTLPQRVYARVPFASIPDLAADDRVFAVYGPGLKMAPLNAVAAQLSSVTPLFSAPYNLTGAGVVVSEFEFATAEAAHPEFGGRLTTHVVGDDAGSKLHATHVAGTIIASGIVTAAKGMAPGATLHEFDARSDYPIVMDTKQNQLPPLGIIADNNSWGFQLGWQFDPTAAGSFVWYGGEDYFGGYDGFYDPPYDKIARTGPVFFVQSAGNDGDQGSASLVEPPFYMHGHADDNGELIKGETFCYSANGSGTDCPAACTAGPGHCEIPKHPTYGPFKTVGPTGSLKNVVAIGSVDSNKNISSFSSRGPTHDGRVKPDLVTKGNHQYSTIPGGKYGIDQGTSMSAPVATGVSALLTEQWRKTFAGQNPLPIQLKTLLIAGADDLGLPGPDYTYGYGLVNAQASVDLILADGNTGSRLRLGTMTQGQQVETPITITAAQNLRVVVSWFDPEVLLGPNDLAEKTLVNDLDIKVIDTSSNAVLPYVLDGSNTSANATRGVNTVDNTEEVEIKNAPAGTYRVVVTGTNVAISPQQYVLAANASLGAAAVVCNDAFEPNDTEATAFGNLVNGEAIAASICSATDVDYYRIRTTAPGPLTVSLTTTDTAVRVTLSGNGISPVVRDITARTTGSVSTQTGSGVGQYIVKVEPTGTVGATHTYTLTPTFSSLPVSRRRASRH